MAEKRNVGNPIDKEMKLDGSSSSGASARARVANEDSFKPSMEEKDPPNPEPESRKMSEIVVRRKKGHEDSSRGPEEEEDALEISRKMSEIVVRKKKGHEDSSRGPEEEEDVLEKSRGRAQKVEESISPSSSSSRSERRVFKKRLTESEVYYGRMTISVEDAKRSFIKPKKTENSDKEICKSFSIDVLDERREFISTIEAHFDEFNNRYMLIIGWSEFAKENNLKPNDTIIFTYSPFLELYTARVERWLG